MMMNRLRMRINSTMNRTVEDTLLVEINKSSRSSRVSTDSTNIKGLTVVDSVESEERIQQDEVLLINQSYQQHPFPMSIRPYKSQQHQTIRTTTTTKKINNHPNHQIHPSDPLLFPSTTHHQRISQDDKNRRRVTYQSQDYSIRFPSNPPIPRPQLSASIASIYNVALVYLHRGLDLHQSHLHSQPTYSNFNPKERKKQAYESAIIKGFNQILFLEIGLERCQSNLVLNQLIEIVMSQSDQDQLRYWEQTKRLLVYVARFRPRVEMIGRWSKAQVSNRNYKALVELWSEIQSDNSTTALSDENLESDHNQELTILGMNPDLFTSLVIVSSTVGSDGLRLRELVRSITDRIVSRVRSEDGYDLSGLDDPNRASYYLRAVQLGLDWRQMAQRTPRNDYGSGSRLEDDQKEVDEDQRIIHLIRRNLNSKQPDQIDEVISIMENITIGVEGGYGQEGWLEVEWTEPDPLIREKNLSDLIASKEIVLTQRVIGCLMTGFAEIGRSEILDRLISFSRRRSGGMSRYLWMSILRGLVDLGKPDLIKRFVERMRSEDGFEPDLQVQCILISGTISSNFQKGLEQIDRLISTSSTSTGDDEKRVEDEQLSPTNTVVLANTVPTENFNVIISTLLRHRLIDRAKDLIEIVSQPSNQSFISKPNSTTLNHFLKFYSIQDHSPPPSSSSSDPLQQQHQQQQQPSLAEVLEVLKKFEGLGVKPDVISFTILFNILIKLGFQTKEMIGKVLKLMSVMGVEANAITYGSIINQLCKTNQPRDVFVAYEILEEIERLGVATTTITYTALIQALLRNHTKEYTSQNPSLIPSPIPNGNSSNLNAASTASSGTTAMTTESLTLAISLIDRLKSRDFSINQVIYNALINTMMITGQIPRAIQILKILRDDHHRRRLRRLQRSLGYKEKLSKGDDDRGGCDYYYGNGLMDSYGIVLRRLIEFGQLDLAREVCKDFRVEFLGNQFRGHGDPNKNVGDDDDGSGGYVPDWIRKYIELIERSF